MGSLDTPRSPCSVPVRRPRISCWRRNGLTPREHQIAGLVLGGLSNDQIARKLYVSRHTVGDHVKAILRKIGARSKQEFIASILGRVGRATDSAS